MIWNPPSIWFVGSSCRKKNCEITTSLQLLLEQKSSTINQTPARASKRLLLYLSTHGVENVAVECNQNKLKGRSLMPLAYNSANIKRRANTCTQMHTQTQICLWERTSHRPRQIACTQKPRRTSYSPGYKDSLPPFTKALLEGISQRALQLHSSCHSTCEWINEWVHWVPSATEQLTKEGTVLTHSSSAHSTHLWGVQWPRQNSKNPPDSRPSTRQLLLAAIASFTKCREPVLTWGIPCSKHSMPQLLPPVFWASTVLLPLT